MILFYSLLIVLAILWMSDLYQTVSLTKKYGVGIEENPFARFLLKQSRKEFAAFKVVDLALLSAIMIFLTHSREVLANGLLLCFVALYAFTVAHNHGIIKSYSSNK